MDVVEMKLSKIVDLIKGPKDTIVSLKIRPIKSPSSTKIVKIVRDKIKLTANLASASIYNVETDRDNLSLGVIELPSFYGSSGEGHKATDDVEELIEKLKEEYERRKAVSKEDLPSIREDEEDEVKAKDEQEEVEEEGEK